MKALVIYDSAYGNTADIARAVSGALRDDYRTSLVATDEVGNVSLDDIDLLVVGSPTQGGRATVHIQEFIDKLPGLEGKKVAVFDTRFAEKDHGLGLRLIMRAVGFAADKMAHALTAKGGELVAEPEGFIVKDKTGPLREGELERAEVWARNVSSNRAALSAS